jgi:hypothetical protein
MNYGTNNKYEGAPCKNCGSTLKYKNSRHCVACTITHMNQWRKTPKGKSYFQTANREKRYGLSENDFNRMLVQQNHKCSICYNALTHPHVDHDHITGKVRGVLCGKCNKGLGFFSDNVTLLRSAITYLEEEHI